MKQAAVRSAKVTEPEKSDAYSKGRLLALVHSLAQLSNEKIGRPLGDRTWTIRQIQLLDAIDRCGGGTQMSLTSVSGIDRSTVSEMMTRLTRRGLISRNRSKIDRRAYTVKLTDSGRALLAETSELVEQAEATLLAPLSPDQRTEFVSLLRIVVDNSVMKQAIADTLNRAGPVKWYRKAEVPTSSRS